MNDKIHEADVTGAKGCIAFVLLMFGGILALLWFKRYLG